MTTELSYYETRFRCAVLFWHTHCLLRLAIKQYILSLLCHFFLSRYEVTSAFICFDCCRIVQKQTPCVCLIIQVTCWLPKTKYSNFTVVSHQTALAALSWLFIWLVCMKSLFSNRVPIFTLAVLVCLLFKWRVTSGFLFAQVTISISRKSLLNTTPLFGSHHRLMLPSLFEPFPLHLISQELYVSWKKSAL